ncbi:MAG: hypothetical protein HC856_04715 [Pseudanabaena sp. RU_4_16]|nr:hypothetical protein [Pseudanabaena sp. RU_4_16]
MRFSSTDEPPCPVRTSVGMPVQRGGDAEGVGVGDRFAQEIDQRVANARVLDTCGCEKKLHDDWCLHGCVSEAEQALIAWPNYVLPRVTHQGKTLEVLSWKGVSRTMTQELA